MLQCLCHAHNWPLVQENANQGKHRHGTKFPKRSLNVLACHCGQSEAIFEPGNIVTLQIASHPSDARNDGVGVDARNDVEELGQGGVYFIHTIKEISDRLAPIPTVFVDLYHIV